MATRREISSAALIPIGDQRPQRTGVTDTDERTVTAGETATNNQQEVHMLSTVPPQNLLEVAERLESEGRPHEAQQWRECAAEYDYLCSRRVRETIFDACFFGLSGVLSVLIFVVLIG